ncbi:MAG: ABC transporter permease [Patescibacteria group bacterium]|nr:ABC transporter permease [Patescibacteria group bacterium]
MTLIRTIKISYQAIIAHKVRAALTVLGLTIGVLAIILVINLGQGFENYLAGQMEMFGTDYIDIEPRVPKDSRVSQMNSSTITTLTMKDAEVVAEHPNIRDYYVGLLGQAVTSYQGKDKATMLFGISATGFDLYKPQIEQGRPFTDEEDKSLTRVAVIGRDIKEELFGQGDAIGERIRIGKHNFQVIGVMEKQGAMGPMKMDEIIFVPVRTLQKLIMGVDHIQMILAYMYDTSQAETTAIELKQIIMEQHEITDENKADFEVMTSDQAMDILDQITGAVNLLLLAIAMISLLVGGVGIMNIMYVSVSERTYEIGLRKSVGATQSNILWQFLWEALFLTLIGGLIGVILGTGLTFLAGEIAIYMGFDLGNLIALQGIFIGIGFSLLVGLIFGIYPARKAAQLDPITALRKE